MKNIVMAILLLASVQTSFADDACKLYLCLMGASDSDGGSTCKQRIQEYTDKFKSSCPDLPTCIGTSGPGTSGVLMSSVSGNGGSTQGPENGLITLGCVEYKKVCAIVLTAPAIIASGGGVASCGGQ